jgi:hypothetical protein
VEQIFAWRTLDHLGTYAIARRLAADPDLYPPPDPATGWTPQGVWKILSNPKYTGHMVYGRRRTINGRTRAMPPDQWIWSPQPVHPAIVDRATWDAAQAEGRTHSTATDEPGPTAHSRRTYVLRSRIRCRACSRRMYGATRPAPGGQQVTYYLCPHNPSSPRHAAQAPDHPTTVALREDKMLAAIAQFCDERILGPDRAALLAATYPATAVADQARRTAETTRLTRRLKMIDAFEDAHTAELEALITTGATPQALTALRTRHIRRFTELETERADINTRLTALTAPANDDPDDPALLDQLPVLPGILHNAADRVVQQILATLDIQAIYHRKANQVTIRAAITTTTPAAVLAIIAEASTLTAQTAAHASTSDFVTGPIDRESRTAHGLRCGWC